MKNKFSYSLISEERKALFGIAILWIMLFHSTLVFPPILSKLTYIKEMGNIGVEIFLFLSAIGLFFSLKRDPDILGFYQRRMKRILLPTFLVTSVWFAVYNSGSGTEYIENVFLISFWKDGIRYEWFIALIVPLYLVFPYLFLAFKKSEKSLLFIIIIVILANCILRKYKFDIYRNIEIATLRIPIFLIGLAISEWIFTKKTMRSGVVAVAFAAILVFSLVYFNTPYTNPYIRYIYIPITVALVIFISVLLNKVKNYIRCFYNFLCWIGGYTLELYLVHEKVLTVLKGKALHDKYNLALNLSAFVLSIIIAVFISEFSKKALNAINGNAGK